MAFTPNTTGKGQGVLPIINTGPRARGFAGLISDASLLDVEAIVIDQTSANGGGTANGLLFRAGTVAIVTSVNEKTGTRRGKPAVAADAKGPETEKRFVAISFSHDTCDQSGEIYVKLPDVQGVAGVKPANGVNTGRVWLFLNGAKPAATGKAPVAVADIPSAGAFDATKPFTNGAVKKATVTTGATPTSDAIPGWFFTGQVDIDPATGYQIAEVEINRA